MPDQNDLILVDDVHNPVLPAPNWQLLPIFLTLVQLGVGFLPIKRVTTFSEFCHLITLNLFTLPLGVVVKQILGDLLQRGGRERTLM